MSFAPVNASLSIIVNALLPSAVAILVAWFMIRARHPRIALVTGLGLNTLILLVAFLAYFNFDLSPALTCFYACGEWNGPSVSQLELGLNLGSILVALFVLTRKPTQR